MKLCPFCRAVYESSSEGFCTVDGCRLVLAEDFEAAGGDPMLGRNVAGRFAVVGLIGRGGMGTVYKAVQAEIERTVALKVLKRELADSDQAVRRFRREARAASLLSSPHTVTLHEFGQDEDGTLFLAMELLEGESLSERIARRGVLPWREALGIVAGVAESLGEAHDNGIVHRDLKPENIFLAEGPGGREIPKVLDFGIARMTQTEGGAEVGLTQTGMIFGTPGYMSPEQAKGQTVDARSDLYSLGVVLYEMLAGRPPFEAEEAVLLMGHHLSSDVPLLEDRAPGVEVPPAVESLVRQLLVKDPDRRVQNVRELLDELTRLLGGDLSSPAGVVDVTGLGAPTPRARESAAPTPRSRRSVYAVVAIVVLLGGGALGVALALPGIRGEAPATAAAVVVPTPADPALDAGPVMVEVEVAASPQSARILLDGVPVEGNPHRGFHVRSEAEHVVRIEAEGFVAQEIPFRLDADQRLRVALVREAVEEPQAKTRPGKRPGGRPDEGPVKAPTKRPLGIDTRPPDDWGR